MASRLLSRRTLALGAGAGLADALLLEPRWLDVSVHDVAVARLPRGLDGFSIAQISDAHLGSFGMVEERIVVEVAERNVQLVVMTGDLVDDPARLPVLRDLCHALREKGRTVVATLGNWEHWSAVPLEALHATYAESGARLLRNEALDIESALHVIATDDSTAGTPELSAAFRELRRAPVSVLLTHSPELLDRLPREAGRTDLALAGHTHGGQVTAGFAAPLRPPGSGRFVAGWYDVPPGRAYVSRGTGTSLAPARFLCRPELPIFTLRQG